MRSPQEKKGRKALRSPPFLAPPRLRGLGHLRQHPGQSVRSRGDSSTASSTVFSAFAEFPRPQLPHGHSETGGINHLSGLSWDYGALAVLCLLLSPDPALLGWDRSPQRPRPCALLPSPPPGPCELGGGPLEGASASVGSDPLCRPAWPCRSGLLECEPLGSGGWLACPPVSCPWHRSGPSKHCGLTAALGVGSEGFIPASRVRQLRPEGSGLC